MENGSFVPKVVYVHSGKIEVTGEIPFRTTMFYEIELIVESRDGREDQENGSFPLTAGTIYIRRPGTRTRPRGEYRYFAIVFDCIYDPAYEEKYRLGSRTVSEKFEKTGIYSPSIHFSPLLDDLPARIPIDNFSKYLACFSDAFLHFLSRDEQSMVFAYNDLMTIVSMLLRDSGKKNLHMSAELIRQLQTAKEYIDAYFYEKITLMDLADQAKLCREYFCRQFKQYFGVSPIDYLLSVRMHHARFLLSNTDKTVSRIVMECGFSNEPYFYKSFRKLYGISPQEFRSQISS